MCPLCHSTAYDLWVVAQDLDTPPAITEPQLVQFTTLEGRKWFGVGRGGRENNRLGLGDVRDHWTPHAVPAWDNVTVDTSVHFAQINLPCT